MFIVLLLGDGILCQTKNSYFYKNANEWFQNAEFEISRYVLKMQHSMD